ncbi:hypothetical protein PR048_030268 [Dryococelus australis]|uniref:Uncharacterized protein n=1 Tax=Dryococelus australis TaxID=614101 RepID=A0ABQ9G8H9_9NEOP|nr:hypothetical protein PR048_030268 [Dryococelus australis]
MRTSPALKLYTPPGIENLSTKYVVIANDSVGDLTHHKTTFCTRRRGKTWQEKLRKCIARFFGKKETPAEDKAQEGPSSDAPAVVKTDTPASALEIEARVSEETGVPSQVEDVKMSTEDAAAPRQGESAGARAEETKPDAGSDGEDKQQTEVQPSTREESERQYCSQVDAQCIIALQAVFAQAFKSANFIEQLLVRKREQYFVFPSDIHGSILAIAKESKAYGNLLSLVTVVNIPIFAAYGYCVIRWSVLAASLQGVVKCTRQNGVSMEQRRNERTGGTGDPEKTRRPTESSGKIPTCKNPVTRPDIEPISPWWEASRLTAQYHKYGIMRIPARALALKPFNEVSMFCVFQAQEGKKSDVPADVAPVVDSGTSEKEVLPEETDKPSKVECAKACTEETAASGQVDNAGACIVETAKPVLEARSCPADSSLDKQPMAEVHPSAHEESEASAGLEHPRGRTFSLFKRSSH